MTDDISRRLKEVSDEVFQILQITGHAKKFAEMMRLRAELTARSYAMTPKENREMAMGQISICYELADGATSALSAPGSYATDAEVERIRKEVADMK